MPHAVSAAKRRRNPASSRGPRSARPRRTTAGNPRARPKRWKLDTRAASARMTWQFYPWLRHGRIDPASGRAQVITILHALGVLGLPEHGELHACAPDIGRGDVRTVQARAAEVRFPKIGATQVGSIETSLPDVRSPEIGAGEIRAGEVRAAKGGGHQARGPKVGAAELHSERVGFSESRFAEDRVAQIRFPEIASREVGLAGIHAGQVG